MASNSALEHLAAKAREIQSDPAGKYDCTHLAGELKRKLEAEGKPAEIFRFGILDQYGEPQQPVSPVKFSKKWLYHDVCCCEDQIYDPLTSEEPIPLEEYSFLVFRTNIPYHAEDELLMLYMDAANRPIRV